MSLKINGIEIAFYPGRRLRLATGLFDLFTSGHHRSRGGPPDIFAGPLVDHLPRNVLDETPVIVVLRL